MKLFQILCVVFCFQQAFLMSALQGIAENHIDIDFKSEEIVKYLKGVFTNGKTIRSGIIEVAIVDLTTHTNVNNIIIGIRELSNLVITGIIDTTIEESKLSVSDYIIIMLDSYGQVKI